jgi:molybdenum-dependent DNA-binding transcriptional regulator ModE
MTLFSYEIFDAVARQGSFNKAAQQLHLTPSAISHAIAVMEAELGFTLFNRGKNGVADGRGGQKQLLGRFVKAALTRDCIENFVRKQRHVPSLLPFSVRRRPFFCESFSP